MRTGNTRMLGIMGGDIGMEQVGSMVAGALEELEAHNYTLKLLPTPQGGSVEAAQEIASRSSELRLQGAIALHLSREAIAIFEAEANRYGYPLLLLDTRAPQSALPAVVSDDEGGIAAAVEHLVALGHRRIALIAGAQWDDIVPLRQAAFEAALRAHGLELPDACLQYGDFNALEANAHAARALLSLPASKRPTALFCMGDLIAMAALQVASEVGLRVPQQLSVVGFADFTMAKFANPPLTTVRQDFGAMGQLAARQILKLCDKNAHNAPLNAPPLKALPPEAPDLLLQRVPTQLIVRGTTASVPT